MCRPLEFSWKDLLTRSQRIFPFALVAGVSAALTIAGWHYWTHEYWAIYMSYAGLFLGAVTALILLVLLPLPLRLRLRPAALNLLFLITGFWIPVFLGSLFLNDIAHDLAIRNLLSHAGPTIDALEAYQADHGRPANTLGELVPDFLPKLPEPAYDVCYQSYQLIGGVTERKAEAEAVSRDRAYSWEYFLQCPLDGFFSMETLLYRSDGDYTDISNFGARKPIGNWMYYYFYD